MATSLWFFARRADHGRAADVDVLDGVGQGAAGLGHGGGERVEVDRDQVDRVDAVFGHHRAVEIATAEDAAVDLRMQGLHPAVHHFREAGVVGHFHGGDAVVTQQLEGAAGGEDLDAEGGEFAGEVDDAGLVGHADQRAADGQAGGLVGHLGFHQDRIGRKAAAAPGVRFGRNRGYSRSYCLSFLRRVPRFRPSSSEALVWLPLT